MEDEEEQPSKRAGDGWVTARRPSCFKHVKLEVRRQKEPPAEEQGSSSSSSKPARKQQRPLVRGTQRSRCRVQLSREGEGAQTFEFFIGHTFGYTGGGFTAFSKGSRWSPPLPANRIEVPEWVSEAVLELHGLGDSAEFRAAEGSTESRGGLEGTQRLELLEVETAADVFGDGGILVCPLERCEGDPSGAAAKPRDLAKVRASWRVWFAKNSELLLDFCNEAHPWSQGTELVIDESPLMAALELSFKEVEEGQQAFIYISDQWANGPLMPNGNPCLRGAAVWVEVAIHAVENEQVPGELEASEVLSYAQHKKTQGNTCLEGGSLATYGRAVRRYQAGIKALEAWQSSALPEGQVLDEAELHSLLTSLRLNAALAEFRRKCWREAVELCSAVLETQELPSASAAKAHYRRGLCHVELDDLEGASQDFRAAVTASTAAAGPGGSPDPALRRELAKVEARKKQRRAEEKSTFGGIFEKMKNQEEAKQRREEEEQAKLRRAEEEEARRRAEEEETKWKQAEAERKEAEAKAAQEAGDLAAAQAAATPEAASKVEEPPPAAQADAPPKEVLPVEPKELEEEQPQSSVKGVEPDVAKAPTPPPTPPDLPAALAAMKTRTTEQPPPVQYEVPAFLRRKPARKA